MFSRNFLKQQTCLLQNCKMGAYDFPNQIDPTANGIYKCNSKIETSDVILRLKRRSHN